jgi:hypothetical protein
MDDVVKKPQVAVVAYNAAKPSEPESWMVAVSVGSKLWTFEPAKAQRVARGIILAESTGGNFTDWESVSIPQAVRDACGASYETMATLSEIPRAMERMANVAIINNGLSSILEGDNGNGN